MSAVKLGMPANKLIRGHEPALKSIFSSIQPFTMLDDEGRIGATLFTGGCNLRCTYCHNPQFVLPQQLTYLPKEKIVDFLKKRVGLLESITICGGEPAVHENLERWLRFIKSLGYRVKLDTNGLYPERVECYLKGGLVDFVSIDYKIAEFYDYKLSVRPIDFSKVRRTIHLILESCVEYEVRSTVHPDIHSHRMILKMIEEVSALGVRSYYLQHYIHREKTLGNLEKPKNQFDLSIYMYLLEQYFDTFGVRNI